VGRVAAAAAASLVLVVAGCDDSERQTTTDAGGVPGPSDTIVVYARSGGIGGIRDALAVRPDGAARIATRNKVVRIQLGPSEVNGLRAARAKVDFAKLKSSYGEDPPPPDTFTTTVRADGRTVTLRYGGNPPQNLFRLVLLCSGIVQRHAPR
jgi:hypothetical protein